MYKPTYICYAWLRCSCLLHGNVFGHHYYLPFDFPIQPIHLIIVEVLHLITYPLPYYQDMVDRSLMGLLIVMWFVSFYNQNHRHVWLSNGLHTAQKSCIQGPPKRFFLWGLGHKAFAQHTNCKPHIYICEIWLVLLQPYLTSRIQVTNSLCSVWPFKDSLYAKIIIIIVLVENPFKMWL